LSAIARARVADDRPAGAMKRLWYVEVCKHGDAFEVKVRNVFDGSDDDEPVETRVARVEDVEAILRAIAPFARIPRRYMEVSGFGGLLRIASYPKAPAEELIKQELAGIESAPGTSVLVSPFLTRREISRCLRRRAD